MSEQQELIPEGIVDSIFEKIKSLASWPFKSAVVYYVKNDVSAWLKEATLKILDGAESKVLGYLDTAYMSYADFRKTIELDWDSYVDAILYQLGFVSVPQGENGGPALVQFSGIPLESTEQETESVFVTVLIQIVLPILIDVIGNWFSKK
jgi:ABC-type amino acid transport system, permease component